MLKTLSPQEEVILERLIEVLSGTPEVEEIVLYGSRARGTSAEGSDMDILVLYRGSLNSLEKLKREALQEIEDYLYVSIVPYPVEDFRKGRSEFAANVKREGIVLWKRKDQKR